MLGADELGIDTFAYQPVGTVDLRFESADGDRLLWVQKDEFTGIKSVTRDDMLASLRIPPQLMGIVPQNSGGFGSIREAATVWAAMELEPIQTRMLAINDWLGEEVIAFDPMTIGQDLK